MTKPIQMPPPSVEDLAKAIYDAVWAHLYETYMTPDQARRVAATVLGSDVFAPARQCQESADLDIRGDEISVPATRETVTAEMVARAAHAFARAKRDDTGAPAMVNLAYIRAALEAALGAEKGDDRG